MSRRGEAVLLSGCRVRKGNDESAWGVRDWPTDGMEREDVV